jgi:hypothetical protein
MSVADGFVLVPTIAAILVLALYPQLVLDRSEESVQQSVQRTQALTTAHGASLGGGPRNVEIRHGTDATSGGETVRVANSRAVP